MAYVLVTGRYVGALESCLGGLLNWGSGVRWSWWDLTTDLCWPWIQVFLSFRPQERSLDIPGGPAEQYCSLARDLQLHAFLQFVSAVSPPVPLIGRWWRPTRVIFRSQALTQLSHPIGEGALFLHLLIKIAQPMCSEPRPVPGSVPAFPIPDLIYPPTHAFR